MEHLWWITHFGHVALDMYMMLYFDDLSWFMLEMSLNDYMIKYMPWYPCIYILDLWFLLNIAWWTHDYVDEHLLYMMGLWWYECIMLKSYDDS